MKTITTKIERTPQQILSADAFATYQKFHKAINGVSREYRDEMFYEFLTPELINIHNDISKARFADLYRAVKRAKGIEVLSTGLVKDGYYNLIEYISFFVKFEGQTKEVRYMNRSLYTQVVNEGAGFGLWVSAAKAKEAEAA
tara:strand:+ start:63 stop:488 length:426 start_codon:yes stop_codon:yes gene_type:complete